MDNNQEQLTEDINTSFEQKAQDNQPTPLKKASFFLTFFIIFLPVELIIFFLVAKGLPVFFYWSLLWQSEAIANLGISLFLSLVNLGISLFLSLFVKLYIDSRKFTIQRKQKRLHLFLSILVLVVYAWIFLYILSLNLASEFNRASSCRNVTTEKRVKCLDSMLPDLDSCENFIGHEKEQCLLELGEDYHDLYIVQNNQNSYENVAKNFDLDYCSNYANDVEERICYHINFQRCQSLHYTPDYGEVCFDEIETYIKDRYNFGYGLPHIIKAFNTNDNETLLAIYDYNSIYASYVSGLKVHLDDKGITNIPSAIGQLKTIHTILLRKNEITTVPKEISLLKNLRLLSLGDNNISEIPPELGKIVTKDRLQISFVNNNITEIPIEIFKINNLVSLSLGNNQISKAPDSDGPINTGKFNLGLKGNPITNEEVEKFKLLLPNATIFFDDSQ